MPAFNKNDFSGNPVRLDIARSRFAMPYKHKTTFTAGKLIPIFSYGDVLPGDSYEIDMASLVRMVTPVFPTMDDAYMDVYFFFTPHKLTLGRQMMSPAVNDAEHSWNAFIGAQDSLLNVPTPGEVLLPLCRLGKGGGVKAEVGSLTDYLGLPLSNGQVISCLEPLAYYSIWNNYFRDENTMNPIVYSVSGVLTGESNPHSNGRREIIFSGFDGTVRWGSRSYIGDKLSILPVCRPHGYFGSALPWPQRNLDMVGIPLQGLLPVIDIYGHKGNGQNDSYVIDGFHMSAPYDEQSASFVGANIYPEGDQSTVADIGYLDRGGDQVNVIGMFGGANTRTGAMFSADASSGASMAVNALRLAVQTQRWFEALARGGNRIGEISSSMFGVTPSDYANDRPEYLGGKRIPIQIDQVANTAGPGAGGQGQTLGSLGAYSNTGDSGHYVTKSMDTWGTLTCVICVRTNESFTQGIPKRYQREKRFDFYWPQFANLGEQPILKSELYVPSSNYAAVQDEVFGYQEAWAEYRYLSDIVSGHLRPDQDLGAYTYANYFTAPPTLAGYIDGTAIADNVDRTLTVTSAASGFQFIGDFAFNIVVTRPMPRYSIPGLVDHH